MFTQHLGGLRWGVTWMCWCRRDVRQVIARAWPRHAHTLTTVCTLVPTTDPQSNVSTTRQATQTYTWSDFIWSAFILPEFVGSEIHLVRIHLVRKSCGPKSCMKITQFEFHLVRNLKSIWSESHLVRIHLVRKIRSTHQGAMTCGKCWSLVCGT